MAWSSTGRITTCSRPCGSASNPAQPIEAPWTERLRDRSSARRDARRRSRRARPRPRRRFKQAHREVYLLTPAEREAGDRSPRFAGFVLRQHALAALAAQRGWRYRLQGPFDPGGDPDPALGLPEHGLTATLETELIEDEALQSGHAIFLYVRTGPLRFRRD